MSSRLAFLTALGLTMVMAFGGTATAGPIQAGDLIVVDRGNLTVDDVNPTTGASFVIANGSAVFSGLDQGLAINAQGMIFVSDIGNSTIYEVNPTTGVITPFSSNVIGTGPTMSRPFEMQFLGNTLYVADGGPASGTTSAVYTVDANGNRTLVAGGSNSLFGIGGAAGIAVTSAGSIFASAPSPSVHTVYGVGPGTATPLTTTVLAPQGLAIGANGQLLAVSGNPSNALIASINPMNGITVTLSDNNGIGTGPAYGSLRGITVGNGSIYVTDTGNQEIFKVDAANGNRSVLSGNGIGGTTFGALSYGIAVYPTISPAVPEPSGLALLAVGVAGMVIAARRRGSRRAA